MSDSERNAKDDDLDDLETEVVEDLDADEDADNVQGGTVLNTGGCPLR